MGRKSNVVYQNKFTKVSDNSLWEIESDYPPITSEKKFFYRSYLTLNGDGTTIDMKVDGSTTTQDFFITADENFDTYINVINFFIAAELTITDLSEFGGAPALTNGCQLFYINGGDTISINDDLKTNFDLLRMCTFKPSFSNGGSNAFKVQQVFSNNDSGYFGTLSFKNYGFEPEYRGGIRLKAGTFDRIIFRIRDNLNLTLSQLSTFDMIAYGYQIQS